MPRKWYQRLFGESVPPPEELDGYPHGKYTRELEGIVAGETLEERIRYADRLSKLLTRAENRSADTALGAMLDLEDTLRSVFSSELDGLRRAREASDVKVIEALEGLSRTTEAGFQGVEHRVETVESRLGQFGEIFDNFRIETGERLEALEENFKTLDKRAQERISSVMLDIAHIKEEIADRRPYFERFDQMVKDFAQYRHDTLGDELTRERRKFLTEQLEAFIEQVPQNTHRIETLEEQITRLKAYIAELERKVLGGSERSV